MILDCDLLIGRDVVTAHRLSPEGLKKSADEAGIQGGVVSSLRALTFDAPTGNDDAHRAAEPDRWWVAAGVDARDPLGAEAEIARAAEAGTRAVRLAPQRQGVPPGAPGLLACARRASATGLLLIVEGDFRTYGPALAGLGARAIFVDLHFYQLGDFVVLARDEPGFHASTRLLGNLDAWETVAGELGVDRLVFGSRAGWFEPSGVLMRLATSDLSEIDRTMVTSGNLRRLMGEAR